MQDKQSIVRYLMYIYVAKLILFLMFSTIIEQIYIKRFIIEQPSLRMMVHDSHNNEQREAQKCSSKIYALKF